MPPSPAPIADAGDDEAQEIAFAKRRCMCCCIPCLPSETSSWWWQRVGSPAKKERWWKKAREWSEIAAGPRWKTFIRRFNNNSRTRAALYAKNGSFRYDPLSYALNFDDGNAGNGVGDDGYGHVGFSARFASISAPMKAYTDVGKDAPELK